MPTMGLYIQDDYSTRLVALGRCQIVADEWEYQKVAHAPVKKRHVAMDNGGLGGVLVVRGRQLWGCGRVGVRGSRWNRDL